MAIIRWASGARTAVAVLALAAALDAAAYALMEGEMS